MYCLYCWGGLYHETTGLNGYSDLMKWRGGGYQRKRCRKQRYLPAPTIVAWYVDPLTFTSMASPRARDIGASCITCFVDTIECASSTHSTKKWRSIFKYFYGYHTVLSTSYISLPANIVPFIFLSWRWVGLADTYAIIVQLENLQT